jgi:hypothetical protein
MFSENHHKILQEIDTDFSGIEDLANKVGLPIDLTRHLLEELKQYQFVSVLYGRTPLGDDAYLETSGRAAVGSPAYFLNKPMNQQNCNIQYFTGPMSGVIASPNSQVSNNQFIQVNSSQNLAQAAQDIKALLDQLTQAYPNDDDFTQAGRAVGAINNNPTLKQRLINAAKESGTTALEKAIEAVIDNPAVSIVIAGVKGFIEAEG